MGYGAGIDSTPKWPGDHWLSGKSFSISRRQPLFLKTGVLWMAHERDAYASETLKTFTAAEHFIPPPGDRRTSPSTTPRSNVAGAWMVFAIFEPDSGALMARRAVAQWSRQPCNPA